MKIGIDCGHCTSGYDTSANGFRLESDLTREVGYKVMSKLQVLGHQVINCTVDHANSMNASLSRRCQIANDNGVDVYISIHFNCSESSQAHGTEVFCYKAGGKGEEYAKKVLNEMVALEYTNRGVKTANFYVLRNTNAPAILCECSFVSSKSDMDKYCAEDFANAIVKGITGQTSNVSVPPQPTTPQLPTIRYQAQVEGIGWQGWVRNGETAGTEGKGLRLEALAIDYDGTANICVEGHVENIGWQSIRHDGEIIGTVGEALRLEAIKINLEDKNYSIQYQVHVQDIGWMPYVSDGQVSGTVGQSKRIEAIKIKVVKR